MKRSVDPETFLFFLCNVLQKTEGFARHMDNQINILVGLSSGVFILSVSQIAVKSVFVIPLLILAVFSLSSALISLLAVLPPRPMRKKNQKESLFYNKNIIKFKSPNDYCKALLEASESVESIAGQYAFEIYNLSRYYYRPKRFLFKLARHLLFMGVLLSLVAMILSF